MSKKVAVILFNLGGPDSPRSVKTFLFNLFYDKNIISLPNPLRYFLAKYISIKRNNVAVEIYQHLGGRSPIVQQTGRQSAALEQRLNGITENKECKYKTFVVMRYWFPRAKDVVMEVKKFQPDEVILLPLYPQYSTTTSYSSMQEWKKVMKKHMDVTTPIRSICCYHTHDLFINAHVSLIRKCIAGIENYSKYIILFSAHGLPKNIIDKGDPYQYQIEQTVQKIMKVLNIDIEHTVCYQSKVGRKEWLSPSTEDEILSAAKQKLSVIIVPIAFVSEHSETLVELDIEYRDIANKANIKEYIRVPTLGVHTDFIDALVDLCVRNHEEKTGCPKCYTLCNKQVCDK